MNAIKGYFFVTLWRAILKLITIVVLGVVWLAFPSSSLAMGTFLGACVLWIVDGCDHGIDTIRRRSQRERAQTPPPSSGLMAAPVGLSCCLRSGLVRVVGGI